MGITRAAPDNPSPAPSGRRWLARDPLAPAAWLDVAAPVVGCLLLFVLCGVASGRKYFWLDEMLSWLFVVEPTLSSFSAAWHDTINATPPLYYLVARLWAALFGDSELSLRMMSAACFAGSLALCWRLLRNIFGAWPAAVSVLLVFFASRTVLFQIVEARFYGLFLLEAALATTTFVAYFQADKPNARLLAANALWHASLVTTHYFGLVYSAALVGAAMLLVPGRVRQSLVFVASVGVGWLAFLPCVPAFLVHRQLSAGHFWLAPPGAGELALSYTSELAIFAFSAWVGCGLFWLGLIAYGVSCLRTPDAPGIEGELGGPRAERALAAAVLGLALVPLGTWILARMGMTMFLGRYLLPNLLCWAVLVAASVRALFRLLVSEAAKTGEKPALLVPQIVLVLGVLAILAKGVENEMHAEFLPRPGGDEAHLPAGVPIAIEGVHRYVPRTKYGPSPARYWLVLDREAALLPDAPLPAYNDYQLGLALKRHYPMQIVESDAFLAAHDEFIVSDGGTLWFESRIRGNPDYEVTPADPPAAEPQFFHVRRKKSS